jgi:hypothetical protein
VIPALPATKYARALSLQSAQYATGTALATALQAVMVAATAGGTTGGLRHQPGDAHLHGRDRVPPPVPHGAGAPRR